MMMSGGGGNGASFEGYYVSLTCHNESIFEGEVLQIDESKQLITLTHAHELLPNGKAAKFPQITITGSHVKNLKIIRERINVMAFGEAKVRIFYLPLWHNAGSPTFSLTVSFFHFTNAMKMSTSC